jgi:hypothetical protein
VVGWKFDEDVVHGEDEGQLKCPHQNCPIRYDVHESGDGDLSHLCAISSMTLEGCRANEIDKEILETFVGMTVLGSGRDLVKPDLLSRPTCQARVHSYVYRTLCRAALKFPCGHACSTNPCRLQ